MDSAGVATHLLLDLRLPFCLSSLALTFWEVLDADVTSVPLENLARPVVKIENGFKSKSGERADVA
jgi:hypothetical protein